MSESVWQSYYHSIFCVLFHKLEKDVIKVKDRDPSSFSHHEKTKLLIALHKLISETIPNNPKHPKFNLGLTMGNKYTCWKKVRFLNRRYRLYFRFREDQSVIVYAWFNDKNTLRKEGSKTDPYISFQATAR